MSLRRQTLWSMLPILVGSVISVVSVPVYFRVLGEDMYALWFYVGTLTGAFGFMDLGLGVAVGRFMGVALGANDPQAVREYWSTGHAAVLPFVLFFALVFIVLGVIWGPLWFQVAEAHTNMLRLAMVFGGIGLFFNYYGQMWHILAQTQLDFRFLAVVKTWFALATTAGSLALALVWPNVAAIVAFGSLLAAGQFFILLRRGHSIYQLPVQLGQFRMARLREMLPYTLKTFGHLLSGSVLGSLDRLFLGRVAPALDFAAFNVSLNIGSRLSGLSVAIMGPIFHNTTRGVGGDASRKPAEIYRESFHLMFPWYSLAILGVFFWSEPVTALWLGDKYGPSVGIAFPWVVAALCVNAIANISGAQLGGLDRVGTGLCFQIASSLLAVFGVVFGWHQAGLQGAAIGFFLSRLVWLPQDALVRHWVGLPLREYLDPLLTLLRQTALLLPLWWAARWMDLPLTAQVTVAVTSAVLGAVMEWRLALRPARDQTAPPCA